MTVMAGYNNAADPTTSTVTASPSTNVYANGSASSLITVQVKDEFGSSFGAGGETVSIATNIGTISATTDNNNGTYTATLTSTTVGTATLTATLNGTVVTDTATVAFVDAPPILSSSTPADNATGVSTTANIVLTFSEAVDVESGNITIKKTSGNTTVEIIDVTSSKVTGSGTTTITVNPDTTLDAATGYYVLIDATAFDDTAGESYAGISSTTALSFTTGTDSTPPTMTITAAEGVDGFQSDNATLSLTFTSNEDTVNFTVADITVSNGTLSNFTAVSSTVYTATLTPTTAGAVTIDVAAGTFTDANANNNLAANQFNWTYGSDPTKKADVMGNIQASSNAAIGFTSTSIKSVQNRLDWLRRNKDTEKTSYQGIKVDFNNPILDYVVNNNSIDFTKLTHQAVAHTNTSAQMNNPVIQTAISQMKMNKSVSEMMKQVDDKYQVVSLNPNQSAGPLFNDWSIWTEGKIMVSSLDGSNGSTDQDSDTLNIAIGIDRPTANAGLIGVALNVGTDDVEVGSVGSGIKSKNISLSLYNIFKTQNLLDV
jgi:methionine-rich copper-binding protein CopC